MAVEGLGENFADYAAAIDENGVDGDLLHAMNEDDVLETMDDLNITSKLHRRKLLQEFRRLIAQQDEKENIDKIVLAGKGPVDDVFIKEITCRPQDFPYPEEDVSDIDGIAGADYPERDSHLLPTFQTGLATTPTQQAHLADDFYKAIDDQEGGFRPPIPEDDLERVAQVQAYGLEDLGPDSETAQTLVGYVEMATKLFNFDFGDITFFDHASQFSFARVGLTEEIKQAILGPVYHPINYSVDQSSFLCRTDRSIGICNYPSLSKRTFVVHDIHQDKTFKWMEQVWPFRCYVGTPLIGGSGLVLGTLCLHNLKPRPDFGKAQEVQMEKIAKMVVQTIENWSLRRRIEQLEIEKEWAQTPASSVDKEAPPTDHVVFVHTAVEGMPELTKKLDAGQAKLATELYAHTIEKLIKEHYGYVAESEADKSTHLVAFHNAADAFAFALNLQQALYNAPWPETVLACPEAKVDSLRKQRGLRVQMGVHMGDALFTQPKEESAKYTGQTVEITKSISDMAHGGQIAASFDAWNMASFSAETKLESPQVIDLGTHVVRKGKKVSDGVIAKRIVQLVPDTLAVKYATLESEESNNKNSDNNATVNVEGRQFPDLKSLKKLSKGFFDAPRGREVTIAFIGTSELENRYKESASMIAEIIEIASALLTQNVDGYQCQNNMFSFASSQEAMRFGLQFMDLMRAQKPLEDGAQLARLVTFGCVHGPFVALEPHKTTGRADYFGKVCNRAARVAYTAELGKVCWGISVEGDQSHEQVAARDLTDPNIALRFIGMKQLKGVEGQMALYECKKKRSIGQAVQRWFGATETL